MGRPVRLSLLVLIACGCGDASPGPPDAGDAGTPDARPPDAPADVGTPTPDTGPLPEDSAPPDAGETWPLEDDVRGVRFNPETRARMDMGVDPWLVRYDEPEVRAEVGTELRAIRRIPELTTVTMVMSQIAHFSWPRPTADELRRTVEFIDDANDEGLRVALLISHPCIIPNSAVTGGGLVHVGGHRAGEMVNGVTLYWDVPYCEDTYVEDAIAWFDAIFEGLAARRHADGIAYVAHAGTPHLPFTVEMNILHDGYRYLEIVLDYLSQVIPAMHGHGIPIGISVIPARWLADTAGRYAFLTNLQRAVPITQIDYFDMTSWIEDSDAGFGSVDPDAIIARIGAENAHRMVLADLKLRDSALSWEEAASRQIAMVRRYGFAGYWIWQYKDDGRWEGIRHAGAPAVDESGWRPGILSLLRADAMR